MTSEKKPRELFLRESDIKGFFEPDNVGTKTAWNVHATAKNEDPFRYTQFREVIASEDNVMFLAGVRRGEARESKKHYYQTKKLKYALSDAGSTLTLLMESSSDPVIRERCAETLARIQAVCGVKKQNG